MVVAPLGDERERRLHAAFAEAARRIDAFAPDVIVCFAPDHYNGFFYDLMPPFCIGAAATGVGDYASSAQALRVPEALSERCIRAAYAAGVDVAFSHKMRVDHAAAQALQFLTGAVDRYPVIPVFINAAAPPLPPLARAAALGAAIGAALEGAGVRALFVGSGGLSHDPPMARLTDATPETRAMLLDSRGISPAGRAVRESRVRAAGTAARDGATFGRPLNPAWDRAFLDMVSAGTPARALTLSDDAITADAGCGGQEIRTWIAALSALHAAAGTYTAEVLAFEPIAEWITSMAVLWAAPSSPKES
jgi:2,3-dihydroxyphenylpropionate 1,2-dioxygenase